MASKATYKIVQSKNTLLAALYQSKGIVSSACAAAGVSRQTYYDWLEKDPEFKKAVQDVQEFAIDFVESKLLDNIENGDNISTIFYLKCRGKSRGFVEKTEQDVTVKGNITVAYNLQPGNDPLPEQ